MVDAYFVAIFYYLFIARQFSVDLDNDFLHTFYSKSSACFFFSFVFWNQFSQERQESFGNSLARAKIFRFCCTEKVISVA